MGALSREFHVASAFPTCNCNLQLQVQLVGLLMCMVLEACKVTP